LSLIYLVLTRIREKYLKEAMWTINNKAHFFLMKKWINSMMTFKMEKKSSIKFRFKDCL